MAKLIKPPTWSGKALQGITFWIGHRRSLYNHYPLGESAFVAELCNLIFAHLDKDHVLQCEVMYSELAKGKKLPDIFTKRARADIVVLKKSASQEEPIPKYIIEVKRGSAATKDINTDLRRLSAIKKMKPRYRTMLFIVSEAKRLDRFVTSDGQSVRGKENIPDDDGYYIVRRTYKAAHAFKTIETAQYASLLEVYQDKKKKKKPLPKKNSKPQKINASKRQKSSS
jgi:hypothetical protein